MNNLKNIIKISTCALGLSAMLLGISAMAMESVNYIDASVGIGQENLSEFNSRKTEKAAICGKQLISGKSEHYASCYAKLIVDYGFKEVLAQLLASKYVEQLTLSKSEDYAKGYIISMICAYSNREYLYNSDDTIAANIEEQRLEYVAKEYEENMKEYKNDKYVEFLVKLNNEKYAEECYRKYKEGLSELCIDCFIKLVNEFEDIDTRMAWHRAKLYEKLVRSGKEKAYAYSYVYLLSKVVGIDEEQARKRAEIMEKVAENKKNILVSAAGYYSYLVYNRGLSKMKACVRMRNYDDTTGSGDYYAYAAQRGLKELSGLKHTVDEGAEVYREEHIKRKCKELEQDYVLYYTILLTERNIEKREAIRLANIYSEVIKGVRNDRYADYYTMLSHYGYGQCLESMREIFVKKVREKRSLDYAYVYAYSIVIMKLNEEKADMVARESELFYRNREDFNDGISIIDRLIEISNSRGEPSNKRLKRND